MINKSRPAALAVVKDIMDWADEGGGERARPPLEQAGRGRTGWMLCARGSDIWKD